jgi:hypothetical protein
MMGSREKFKNYGAANDFAPNMQSETTSSILRGFSAGLQRENYAPEKLWSGRGTPPPVPRYTRIASKTPRLPICKMATPGEAYHEQTGLPKIDFC